MSARGSRIHIVGAPSAGKSTLARQLAEQLGSPYHDLDSIAFIDERWTPRAMEERLAMIERIRQQPTWVVEGGHLGWTDPILAAADVILWLDPPLRVLLARHWGRHRSRGFWWLVRYGWAWQVRWYFQGYRHDLAPDADPAPNRGATEAALRPYPHKSYRFRSTPPLRDLERMLREAQL